MAELLTKYGYAPDQEAIGRALELIAANLEGMGSEQVYKDCFSMMDLTTLKTNDTSASVRKLVDKVNNFRQAYPEWPLRLQYAFIQTSLQLSRRQGHVISTSLSCQHASLRRRASSR